MKRILSLILIGVFVAFGTDAVAQEEGESGAKVILTEYSDFQCPSCQYFYPILKKLKKEYGDDLKINYRHFPINSHQYAALAARASEAARKQGKFKEMHDMLFENQSRWAYSSNAQAIFVRYAEKLELDLEKFKEDLNSTEIQRKVMEEKKEGQQNGVTGTPTFFINGSRLEQNPPTFQDFKAIIESYIKERN